MGASTGDGAIEPVTREQIIDLHPFRDAEGDAAKAAAREIVQHWWRCLDSNEIERMLPDVDGVIAHLERWQEELKLRVKNGSRREFTTEERIDRLLQGRMEDTTAITILPRPEDPR